MTKELAERIEDAIEIDPGKFVLYFLSKSNLESEKIMDGVNYKREGNKIIVDIEINDVAYKRFEIIKDKFLDNYSIDYKGCFLKEK